MSGVLNTETKTRLPLLLLLKLCFRLTQFFLSTNEAKIGKNRVAVATLLAHSVNAAMRRQRMMAMAQGGMEWSGVI